MRQGILKTTFLWVLLAAVIGFPILIAVLSPLQVGRDAIYITGSFGGIVCLALLLIQPLLAAGCFPAGRLSQQQRWHRLVGVAILFTLFLHIAGLYLTSPDDMVDALLLIAPTPYSVYGAIALWGLVLTAIVAFTRRRWHQRAWRFAHLSLAAVVVGASVVHALMIEGLMGSLSKILLCSCVLLTAAFALWKLK